MGIEKDIQQPVFRNDYQKAMVNIIFSANWLTERIKIFLESEDITLQQYNILRILRGNTKPISTLQIRERMLDKMSDTSRIVERMLKGEHLNTEGLQKLLKIAFSMNRKGKYRTIHKPSMIHYLESSETIRRTPK